MDFDALDAFLAANPAARAAQAARDRQRDGTAEERLDEYRHGAERQQRQLVQNVVRNIMSQMQDNQEQYKSTIDTLFGRLTREREISSEKDAELQTLRSGIFQRAIKAWRKMPITQKCSSQARICSQGPCPGW